MKKSNILQDINFVASKIRASKLLGLSEIEPTTKRIMKKVLLSTNEETILLISLIDRQCSGKTSSINNLADYFQCSSIEVMILLPALKSLLIKGYIKAKGQSQQDITTLEFSIHPDVFNAILEDKQICLLSKDDSTKFDQYAFCYAVFDATKNKQTLSEFLSFTQKLENKYSDLTLCKELQKEIPNAVDRAMFYVLSRNFCEGKDTPISEIIKIVYCNSIGQGAIARRDLMTEEHSLIKAELIRIYERDIYFKWERKTEPTLSLMEKGIKILFEDAADGYLQPCGCSDRYEFIRKIYQLCYDLPNNPSPRTLKTLYSEISRIERANSSLCFVATTTKLVSDIADRLLFYHVCYGIHDACPITIYDLRGIYDSSRKATAIRELKNKKHILQKQDLIELSSESFLGRSKILLTEKGRETFFEEDIDVFEEKVSDINLLSSDKINEKNLFFDEKLQKQLSTLESSLKEENLVALRERLQENNLPTGIAVLLYGQPGTGKTESVLQIARETSRAVMHVDISDTKSCWFGQSEKIIKEVFTRYRKISEKSKLKPILLFNEADAVFSKRKDSNSSNVAQTENAIQNIILEEMENLDGILIATTNLETNLDSAFERRFLFKVRFDKPTMESKKKIWRDKIPLLSEEDATDLARKFDFSGGEIDNIARKVILDNVISGNAPNIERIITICGEEKIASRKRRIGF